MQAQTQSLRRHEGRPTDVIVQRQKQEKLFESLPHVNMNRVELKMKASTKFLGRIYEVDGRCDRDVAAQMAQAPAIHHWPSFVTGVGYACFVALMAFAVRMAATGRWEG